MHRIIISAKRLLRPLVPANVRERIARWRHNRAQRENLKRSAEEVFTSVYLKNEWGGATGDFCSGLGSTNPQIVGIYINAITELAGREGFLGARFVDLGCGDFRVGRQLLPLCGQYVGVDIVAPLVDRNNSVFGTDDIEFIHLDIIRDDLPSGDVCFVRQVFQHLSNEQIGIVLRKLDRYRWVIITEHQPHLGVLSVPNIDKVHGADIRLREGSGVFLESPPFSRATTSLELIAEVPATVGEDATDGVIRTFLYRPHIHYLAVPIS